MKNESEAEQTVLERC